MKPVDKLALSNHFRAMDFTKDQGVAPAEGMSEEQRMLSTLLLAVNASLVQLLGEGVISGGDMTHFLMRFNDFANRLYKGEKVTFPFHVKQASAGDDQVPQTLAVNSKMGELYALAAEWAMQHGSEVYKEAKAQAEAYYAETTPKNEAPPSDLSDEQRQVYIDHEAGKGKRSVN